MGALLLAGCGLPAPWAARPTATNAGATDRARPLRVGVVFDVGGRGDGAFNDGAHAGAERARQALGADVAYADVKDGNERRAALERFAAEGRDLVIGVGFLQSADASELAGRFPHVRFAVLDFSLQVDAQGRTVLPPANLAGLVFREEEGAFLVGAMAGLATRTQVVGFLGGMRSPLIGRFEAGYAAGVARTCRSCRVLTAYAGTTPAAFGDPAAGERIANAQADSSADVIFHAAGATGSGMLRAAAARGFRAIGVDVDQSRAAPGHVLTSMVKRMDVAVEDVIRRTAGGAFPAGLRAYGLAERGLEYVWDGAGRSAVGDSGRVQVETLRASIVAGLLRAPTRR